MRRVLENNLLLNLDFAPQHLLLNVFFAFRRLVFAFFVKLLFLGFNHIL